jgi:hypothetical protein
MSLVEIGPRNQAQIEPKLATVYSPIIAGGEVP